MADRPSLPRAELEGFCRRWKVQELELFGSAVRNELSPESDLDFLVSFGEAAEWSLLDLVRMEEELTRLLGRRVDLVIRKSIERSRNWIRRRAILEGAEPVYVAE